MAQPTRQIAEFALYGDKQGAIAPEFVHVEPISERSSLYEWTIAPHSHPCIFQLLLITDGAGALADGEGEAPLGPGMLALVPGGIVHAFRFAPDTQGWVLSVADALLDDPRIAAFRVSGLVRGGKALRLPVAPLTARLLERLHGGRGLPDAATLAALALLLALVEESAAALAAAATGPVDHRILLVRRFTALVEARFRQHWPIARYAAELGTTPQTLTRACRRVTGKSPGDIALDRLLREAMRALTFTAGAVAQVSEDLGFADPAYFSRFFKGRAGVEPSRFRRDRGWFRQTPTNTADRPR
ncbi:helix-turn-helix domain-containing protein [Novosphingobium sp.]|uniref:helix-turn-helix domain-containing protein n=1 Tax=Novosphingobium sp. TaxID=1874826 RepID=UPI002736FA3E|nr:helix-turn-helix domain-containing protein [Novosphingobium sp.]MDP3907423.1 helix-turn-helix domain-containing protein [Novosphingobium sp.]